MKPTDLVTEEQAAERIGLSVSFLRSDRCRGHVGNRTAGPPWYQLGRAIRYRVADLDDWLAQRRIDRRAQSAA